MSKIIVLRGNSGSGKSSVARKLQELITPHPVLIEHDHFRRKVLKEKESENVINPELMLLTVKFALEKGKDVIIEGILRTDYYREFFEKLREIHPTENYYFYFDIPFDETLRRHNTKSNAHEFGEKEMREWYRKEDLLGYSNEVVIDEHRTHDQTVRMVMNTIEGVELNEGRV